MTHSDISEYIYGIHIFGYFQKIQTLILWYFLFPCILTGLCSEAVRMLVILSGSAALVITLSLIFSLLYILLPGHMDLLLLICCFFFWLKSTHLCMSLFMSSFIKRQPRIKERGHRFSSPISCLSQLLFIEMKPREKSCCLLVNGGFLKDF